MADAPNATGQVSEPVYLVDSAGNKITNANPLPVTGGGGAGGAVTIADGADVALGTTTDAAYTTGAGTVVAILKGIFGRLIGTGSIATGQVSVTTGNTSIAAARATRKTILITNVTGTGDSYYGNTGVSTTTGQLLPGTKGATLTLDTAAAVFGTVAATAQTVTFTELF